MIIRLFLILALFLSVSLASAQDSPCVDYGDYLHWVGVCPMPGQAWAVAMSGDHAFVADRERGMAVVDVTDMRNPEEITVIALLGGGRDIAEDLIHV